MTEENGWKEYKQFVIQELKRSNDRLEKIEGRLINIEKEMVVLKTKMYIGPSFLAIFFSAAVSTFFFLARG